MADKAPVKTGESGTPTDTPNQDDRYAGMEVMESNHLETDEGQKPPTETEEEETTEEEEAEEEETTEEEETEEEETEEEEAEEEEAEEEEAEGEEAEEEEEETTDDEKGSKKSKGVNKRISKLVKQRNGLRQQVETLTKYVQELASKAPQETLTPAKPKAEELGPKPKLEDFADSENPEADYLEALTDYKVEAKVRAITAEREAAQLVSETDAYKKKLIANFDAQVVEAKKKYKDFDTVAKNPAVPYSDAMKDVVMSSDIGVDIAYYFGKHIAKAIEISRLEPFEAARELGKLEARLSNVKPKVKKVSSAKAPVNPVKKGTATKKVKAEEMSDEEYFNARESGNSLEDLY
jgi:hypothetical protein